MCDTKECKEALEKFAKALETAAEATKDDLGGAAKGAGEALKEVIEPLAEFTKGLKEAIEALTAFASKAGGHTKEKESPYPEWAEKYPQFSTKTQKELRAKETVAKLVDGPNTGKTETVKLLELELKLYSDAARRKQKIVSDQIKKEMDLAKKAVKDAKKRGEEESAINAKQERVEALRLQRRLHNYERFNENSLAITKKTGEAVESVGSVIADGLEKLAEGEKGAVAKMLSEFLRGIAKKHAVLAAAEFAMAITSGASFNPIGAAAHAAAGIQHAAVAALAGGGALAAGDIHRNIAAKAEKTSEHSASVSPGADAPGTLTSGPDPSDGPSEDEGQKAPISHEHMRRNDASSRSSGGAKVVINNPHIYGAGGVKEFANKIRAEIDRQNRAGNKPRV